MGSQTPWIILGAIALVACQPDEQRDAAQNNTQVVVLPELPRLPVAEPPLDREALLLAVAHAASAYAAGANDSDAQSVLDGKRFEVRIRFGCALVPPGGATAKPGPRKPEPFNVRFDPEDRTLRIRATPDLTLDDPEMAALAGTTVEGAEGFWMHRPWLLDAGCPAAPAVPEPLAEAAESKEPPTEGLPPRRGRRVGLAQFYTQSDARTGRRDGRSYEATKVLAEGERPSRQGYDLVLEGRLKPLPGGRIITCSGRSADAPPDCIVSADIDRVRMEKAGSTDIVAEWSASN